VINTIKKLIENKNNSVLLLVVIGVLLFSIHLHLKLWNKPHRIITSDVLSYYAYIPATFIYKDLSFSFTGGDFEKYKFKFWLFKTKDNKIAIMTTMGLSILWLPFFLIAHILAPILGFEADGYSPPYKFALLISSLFYLLIGLLFLKKVLDKYFKPVITSITIILIVLGTNLLYYTTIEATVSHSYSFSLICIFIYVTISWHRKPHVANSVVVGLLAGLITLIRPSNILVLIIFILWKISSFKELRERVLLFIRLYYLVLIMMISFLIVWIPQFIYWKYISGSFLFNTYGANDAGFFFGNPQVFHTLFSYRKGWLVYTPLMIFALIGIFMVNKYIPRARLSIVVFVLLNIYIISSWWCWWYGGSFGQRPFVDHYGIYALGIAAFIKWTIQKQHLIKFISFAIIVMFVFLNLFQTVQYFNGAIHYMAMTKESYWLTFLKLKPTKQYYNQLVWPDYESAKIGKYFTSKEITVGKKYKLLADTLKNKADSIRYYKYKISEDTSYMRLIIEKAGKRNLTIEEMINYDANWLYEQDQKKLKERGKPIEYFIHKIKNDTGLLNFVKNKSEQQNIPLEEMIMKDAQWLYEQNKKESDAE